MANPATQAVVNSITNPQGLAQASQGFTPVPPQSRKDKRFNQAGYDIVSFAVDFLHAIGAPVTASNVGAIVAWANLESSGYNPNASGGLNNPLNIVVTPGDGSVGQGGTQGNIADFPSPGAAIAAYARFWQPKQSIMSALKANAGIPAISSAVNAFYGQWGSGIDFSGAPNITPGQTIPAQGGGSNSSTGGGQNATFTSLFDFGGPLFGSPLANFFGTLGVHTFDFLNAPGKAAGAWLQIGLTLLANWPYMLEFFIGVGMIVAGGLIILVDTKAVREAAPVVAAAAA